MLLHVPVGIVMSIPVFGWGLVLLFMRYEESEDKWVKDQAWKDYYGAIVGFILGLIAQSIIFWCLYGWQS